MTVLGIDLAAQPRKTWACELTVRDDVLEVLLHRSCEDDKLLELGDRSEKVAIDAPFGWPEEFIDALNAHRRFEGWPAPDDSDASTYRKTLSYRETDRFVEPTRRPLSVSTDKLGATAMRCAHLLDRWGVDDRAGAGKFVEVYPAGALARWGLPPGKYKGTRNRKARAQLMRELTVALSLDGDETSACVEYDDALDALVAALVGRAAELGLTDGPPEQHHARAKVEGWIHLPTSDSLPQLAPR